jgi:ribosomal protein S16
MDSRDRRDGAYIDQLGIYQPKRQPAFVNLSEDKALEWLFDEAVAKWRADSQARAAARSERKAQKRKAKAAAETPPAA